MDDFATSPPTPQLSDADLLAGLRAGDEAAFEQLLRRHGGRMLAVARRFFRNEDDARDVVQDAFLAAFQGIGGFEGHSQLGTWLHRIVVNKALQKLRGRQRKPEQSIDQLLPPFQEDGRHANRGASWPESAEQVLERRETRDLVRSGIDRLPEDYRTALLLRDIEGLDNEEAARMLGMNVNAFKTRLHRARQALRTVLHPHFARESA
jgi:RNA polymerase sigma-70 factor (ECF subfamily)